MKIYIHYTIKERAWGGGNQFLKNLCNELANRQNICTDPKSADIILFNSHHLTSGCLSLKIKFPEKKFIHRVDGPMRLYNRMDDNRDSQVYHANQAIADGTIFQSNFSLEKNREMGMKINKPFQVIGNSVDSSIFHKPKERNENKKIQIISTSFSPNIKKGFNVYKFLDEQLNFDLFDYTFVGKSPIEFKNIKNVGIKNSNEISKLLRSSDIYITASENDPCSNSLIEAVSCGACCYALNSGGHSEILNNDKLLFDDAPSILSILNNIEKNAIPSYDIKTYSMKEITDQYVDFLSKA